jgi:hypothetical protein
MRASQCRSTDVMNMASLNAASEPTSGAGSSATSCKTNREEYAPIGVFHKVVQVFSALLAEVLFGAGRFIHDADAPAMLPDLANVALYEEACVIGDHVRVCQRARLAVFGLGDVHRWTRVFLLTTDASCDLIFFVHIVVGFVFDFHELVFVIVHLAGAAAGQRRRLQRAALGLFGLLFGERVWGRRLVGRGLLVIKPRRALGAG